MLHRRRSGSRLNRAWGPKLNPDRCERRAPLDVIATESWASWTFGRHRRRVVSVVDLWTSSTTTHDLAASDFLCFFQVTAVRFWEKFCGFNFCLGALKMEENGNELKFECCVFCFLENKTHSYTFWNKKVFVFGGFSGSEFLKFLALNYLFSHETNKDYMFVILLIKKG